MNRTLLSPSLEHPGLVQIHDGFRHRDLLLQLGITFTKIPGLKERGFIFRYYEPSVGNVEVRGNFPVTIPLEGKLIASPVLVRVVNDDLSKKFNAQLKVIRRAFKVRAKLGAFANVRIIPLLEKMRKAGFQPFKPDAFVRAVNQVDANNIESFDAILYMMFEGQSWRYDDTWLQSERLCERFESTLNSHREKSKVTLNVVTYEVPNEDLAPVEATAV